MLKFYGYQRCSTSKKAQQWLYAHEIAYDYQDLVAEPPTAAQFTKWLTKYQDRGLRYFFNTSGQHYREQQLKLKVPTMSIAQAAALLASDGKLIKRPLVVNEQQLTCGFKPDLYVQVWQNATLNS